MHRRGRPRGRRCASEVPTDTLAAFVAAVIAVFVVDQIIYNSTGEYKLLKQYQRNRLLVFLDPDIDPTGESYNLKQAQIAIGSGGLFGKGLFQGTQHTLGILPEAPTDFIFCVLAEELGFLGVMALLALYAGLVLISFRIAGASSDLFGHDHRHVRRRHVVVPDS